MPKEAAFEFQGLKVVVGWVLLWPFVGWDVLATSVSYICQMKGKHKSCIGYSPLTAWPLPKWNIESVCAGIYLGYLVQACGVVDLWYLWNSTSQRNCYRGEIWELCDSSYFHPLWWQLETL